jgi:deoxyribodipyrimidine photolyase
MLSRITDPDLLDFAASSFTDQVEAVLEEEVPRAKASPYAKRWWTEELSMLRDDLTMKRNRVTSMRRQGEDVTEAIRATQTTRRLYYDEIDRQKKQH